MDRDETLYNYAERCAKKYYELAKDGKVSGLTQHDRKLLEEGKYAFIDWYADAMRNKLAEAPEYSEENWDDKKAERLDKTKEYDGINFLLYGGKSPEQSHEEAEFAKFKELVEDGNWYKMSPGAISAWAGEKGGYDWGSKDDRDRFWNDLSKFDIMYNRARNAAEYENSGYGKLASLVTPSAYETAMRQAITGEYDDSQLGRQVATDVIANSLIGLAPVKTAPGLVGPLVTGGAQAALEAGRQGVKVLNDDNLQFDPAAPMVSGMAGASVPSVAMMLQGAVQKGAQGGLRQFGRGVARGARGVDPVEEEKALIKQRVITARNDVAKQLQAGKRANLGSQQEVVVRQSPAEYEAALEARPIIHNLKLLEPHRPGSVIKSDADFGTGKSLKVKSTVADNLGDLSDDYTGDVRVPDMGIADYSEAVTGNILGLRDGKVTGYTVDLNKNDLLGANRPGWLIADPVKKVDGIKTGITKKEREAMLGFQSKVEKEHRAAVQRAKDDFEARVAQGDPDDLPYFDDDFYNELGTVENTFFGDGVSKEQRRLIQSGSGKLRQTYSLAKAMRQYDKGVPVVDNAENWDAFKTAFPAKAAQYMQEGGVGSKATYMLGLGLGRFAGAVGGSLEPALGISDIRNPFQQKADKFKQSEWYTGLPEEKKSIVEAALKKVEEERKKKGK
jgi:hypothetical protein